MQFIKNPIFFIMIAVLAGLSISGYAFVGVPNSGSFPAAVFLGTGGERSDASVVRKIALTEEVQTTGKVKAAENISLAFERGGKVVSVRVRGGDSVYAGQALVVLDSGEMAADLLQAEASLEREKIALEKLKKPADSLTMLQASDALAQAQESKQRAEDNLKKSDEDGFNTVANAFLDLPTIMSGMEDMFFDSTIDPSQWNIDWYVNQTDSQKEEREKAVRYRNDTFSAYNNARRAYDKNLDGYKNVSRASDEQTIESLILETYETTKIIADAVKISKNYIDFIQDRLEERDIAISPKVTAHQSKLESYTGITNKHLLFLLAIKRTIEDSGDAVINAGRSISERQEYINKLNDGADELDIASQENKIKQAKAAMEKIQTQMSKTVLRAPFAGVVARADIDVGNIISPNMPVIILISREKFEIEANVSETDIAKVKVGDTAKVTLDAYGGSAFSAKVISTDSIETVVGGVNTYKVTLQFVSEDSRVKSGMTANVNIETAKRESALAVSRRAVITKDSDSFVLIVTEKNSSEERKVETGINGSNGYIEILSGVKEGDRVTNFGGTAE